MIVEYIGKLLAIPIAKSKASRDFVFAAVASVAETLLQAVQSTLIIDVRRLKEAFIQRVEAETSIQQAEAKKKLAEATLVANKTTRRSYEYQLQNQEVERAKLDNQKRRVEAILATAKAKMALEGSVTEELAKLKQMEANQVKSLEDAGREAEDEFNSALRQFTLEGGTMLVNPQELQELVKRLKNQKND